jgi:flagellar biosynthesis component FlhA
MPSDLELFKTVGYFFIYPLLVGVVSISIAKWHFEKDIKKRYLLAKDTVANELIDAISNTLVEMWKLANIYRAIEAEKLSKENPEVISAIQESLEEVNKNTMDSYQHLGKAGLYLGTNIVEKVSQFQSELNNMIYNDNFTVFLNNDTWDKYRREKILPVIQELHDELKGTVFDRMKSFRLY